MYIFKLIKNIGGFFFIKSYWNSICFLIMLFFLEIMIYNMFIVFLNFFYYVMKYFLCVYLLIGVICILFYNVKCVNMVVSGWVLRIYYNRNLLVGEF